MARICGSAGFAIEFDERELDELIRVAQMRLNCLQPRLVPAG